MNIILSKNREKKHIDFDKSKQIFYDNFYFGENNMVLKIPILGVKDKISCDDIKIEKFDITKYMYLLFYE